MFLILLSLVAQQQDNVVDVQPAGKDSYTLTLVTTEDAASAYQKMLAAMDQACKPTGVKSKGQPFVIVMSEKPVHAKITQVITCQSAPGSAP